MNKRKIDHVVVDSENKCKIANDLGTENKCKIANDLGTENISDEPLLQPDDRFTIEPIIRNDAFDMYKIHKAAFWDEHEVELDKDKFEDLSLNEQTFIEYVLAFFATSDLIVNENLASRMLCEIKALEPRMFYTFQMAMENIHCVTGDTYIMCSEGYFPIISLVNKNVSVWNGFEYSIVRIKQTSPCADIYTVWLSDGSKLDCTSGHKWITADKSRVETHLLKPGDCLSVCEFPVVCEGRVMQYPHSAGRKFATDKHIENIPIIYNLRSKLSWLVGYIVEIGQYHNIILHEELELLQRWQLFFNTLGVRTRIQCNAEGPFIHVDKSICVHLKQIGLTVNISGDNSQYDQLKVVRVMFNKTDATYCFNEPFRHSGIFNGVYTGQSEVYSKMITTYIKDPVKRDKLRNAVKEVPCVALKAQWAKRWIDNPVSIGERIVAFAIFEGVFFSGAFCCIFWLAESGRMPGLVQGNAFIARDEGLHTDFACLMYTKYVKKRLTDSQFAEILGHAVDIEIEFITNAIPCKLIGMNAASMIEYIKFVANRLSLQLEHKELYKAHNPFPFMDRINLPNKSNFFENRVTEYSKRSKPEIDPYKGVS
jgi:ribonucleotide reductase beta subunit family protein with ferritin-like domain